jgi:hypothetical protein
MPHEADMLIIRYYCLATISAYGRPLTYQFNSHLQGFMVLKAPVTQKDPVTFSTILSLILGTGWDSSAESASFVTCVSSIVKCVTYLLHIARDVGNYIVMVLSILVIIQQI